MQVFNGKGLQSFFSMKKFYLQNCFELKVQRQTIEIFFHMMFVFELVIDLSLYKIYKSHMNTFKPLQAMK